MKLAASLGLLVAIAGFSTLGCQSQNKSSVEGGDQGAPATSASAEKQDKLAKVLGSAIAPAPATTGTSENAPPPDGIIEPLKANQIAALHSAPLVNLGSTGSEPRFSLVRQPLTGASPASLQVAVDLGNGQGLPPVDLKMEFRQLKPATATSPQLVTARILSADMSVPNLPEEFVTQLKRLKGTKFSLKVSANGGAFDTAAEVSGGKAQDMADFLEMISQGVAEAFLPVPAEQVGTGAYWMTTTRERVLGMDWITYGMVKVTEVNKASAKLEISKRRYAVGRDVPIPAGPNSPKLTAREAMASGSSQATLAIPGSMLGSYQQSSSMKMLLDAADGSGQRMMQAGGQTVFRTDH